MVFRFSREWSPACLIKPSGQLSVGQVCLVFPFTHRAAQAHNLLCDSRVHTPLTHHKSDVVLVFLPAKTKRKCLKGAGIPFISEFSCFACNLGSHSSASPFSPPLALAYLHSPPPASLYTALVSQRRRGGGGGIRGIYFV